MNVARAVTLSLLLLSSPATVSCDQQTQAPGQSQTITLSLQKVDCEGCMFNVIENVQAHDAVNSATFDLASAEMTISYDAHKASVSDLLALVKRNGYEALEGGGKGSFMPEVSFPEGSDVAKVPESDTLDLDAQAVSGKVTVVDFYAQWCQPCRLVDEHLAGLMEDRSDIAVRRVDIHAWDSAVAKEFLSGSRALPLIVVYGIDGKRLGEIRGADTAKIDEVLSATAPADSAPLPSVPPPSEDQ